MARVLVGRLGQPGQVVRRHVDIRRDVGGQQGSQQPIERRIGGAHADAHVADADGHRGEGAQGRTTHVVERSIDERLGS